MSEKTEASSQQSVDERIVALKSQIAHLQSRIGELVDERDDLQEQVNSIDQDTLTKSLELYADPANWDGDRRFVPVMRHVDADDPYWPARQALNAAGI